MNRSPRPSCRPPGRSRVRRAILALALLGSLPSQARAQTVELQVSSKRVLAIDTFRIGIVVKNASGDVSFPTLVEDGFKIISGPSERKFSQFSSGPGGSRTLTTISQTYEVRPTRSGRIEIPPVQVKIGGRTVSSRSGATVLVSDVPRSDDFFLELSVSRNTLYREQLFEVTLAVYVRKLNGSQYANVVPFPSQGDTWPRLEIPWIDGLQGFDSEDPQTYLQSLNPQRQGDGFPINDYAYRDFLEQEPWRFPLGPRRTQTKRDADGKAQDYFVFTLKKSLRASEIGKFTIDPVRARGYVFVNPGGGRPSASRVVAQSPAVDVVVRDVPEEGRPASYSGAVGSSFQLLATVSPADTWVGVPMTLKLTVSGTGKMESIGAIPLQSQPRLVAGFRLPRDEFVQTGEIAEDGKSKVFAYSIRPKSADVTEVPPIEFSYFDPEKETFATVTSSALPIRVQQGEAPEVLQFESPDAPGTVEHERVERTLYGIDESPGALEPQEPRDRVSTVQLALLLAPPIIYLALMMFVSRFRRLHADPGLLRSRGAARRARENLAEAARAAREHRDSEVFQAVYRALTGFIADRAQVPSAGLTAAEAMKILEERELPAERRDALRELLESCEQARFGAAGTLRSEATVRDGESHLRALEKLL